MCEEDALGSSSLEESLTEPLDRAREALDSGLARELLDRLGD
jgi:hypothetical protein